jgi:hypothetical protein
MWSTVLIRFGVYHMSQFPLSTNLNLPDEPEWLVQFTEAKSSDALLVGGEKALEIAKYVRGIRNEAWKIVKTLRDVGDDQNWQMGDETDRVFGWYELMPLLKALQDE